MTLVTLEQILSEPKQLAFTSLQELSDLLAEEKAKISEVMAKDFSFFSPESMESVRIRFLGKKSPLTELSKSIRNIPAEERKGAGALINEVKAFAEKHIANYLGRFELWFEEVRLSKEKIDVTLPFPEANFGSRHPISAVTDQILEVFRRIGFAVVDGPELDKEFFNFDALNIPESHPARDMADTFYIDPPWILRTQTSNVQSHALLERGVPLKIVCPGYVYRNEYDLTHVPCFRQIECLVVDKGIHMGHLRHTLDVFFAEVFGRPVKLRLRSSYFPFTEPSAEIDVECPQCEGAGCRSCKHTGWLEMGGCGLVHCEVLRKCGLDPEVYSGFAFGMGLDRLAMIKHAISDLRALFDGDYKFLKSFRLV